MKFKINIKTTDSRLNYIKRACKNKKVLHLGAAQGTDSDPIILHSNKNFKSEFLHSIIIDNAKEVLGLDYNQIAIDNLMKNGIENIRYCDVTSSLDFAKSCENFSPDVIIVGELIEHLSNPGLLLDNISRNFKSAEVIITTPNLLSISYVIQGLRKNESHDIDHVVGFTPRLIDALCTRFGIERINISVYASVIYRNRIFNIIRSLFLKLFPQFSDGIIFHGITNR